MCISNHGYCFIEFENHAITNFAYLLLKNSYINGRKLKVGWSLKPSRKQKSRLLASIDDIAISKSFDLLNTTSSENRKKIEIESDVEYDTDDL